MAAVAFLLMIPWEFSRRDPMIDIGMVATRQFGACFAVMLATGAILDSTTQFLPLLVQQYFGYTATWAGLVLTPGGLVTMIMMVVVGRLSGKVQPRYLIAIGAVICALAMYDLTRLNSDLGFWFFARLRMLLGVGLPLIFIPIVTASYDGVPPQRTDQASTVKNAARNIRAFDWASTETAPISDWFNDVQTADTICADIASAQQAEFASALEVHTRRRGRSSSQVLARTAA